MFGIAAIVAFAVALILDLDSAGYWLVRHRCHRAAIVMWRALRMWDSGPGDTETLSPPEVH